MLALQPNKLILHGTKQELNDFRDNIKVKGVIRKGLPAFKGHLNRKYSLYITPKTLKDEIDIRKEWIAWTTK